MRKLSFFLGFNCLSRYDEGIRILGKRASEVELGTSSLYEGWDAAKKAKVWKQRTFFFSFKKGKNLRKRQSCVLWLLFWKKSLQHRRFTSKK